MSQENTNEISASTTKPFSLKRGLQFRPALVLAIVALLLAAGSWIDQLIRQNAKQEELMRQTTLIDGVSSHLSILQQHLSQVEQKMQDRIVLLEANQAELRNQEIALNGMYEALTRFDSHRNLTEIEEMLIFAGQQLQLSGNASLVLPVLLSVDRRLNELNRPELLALRQSIVADIHRLRELPHLDIVGIVSIVNDLVATIDTLPVSTPRRLTTPSASTPTNTHWFHRLINEIWLEAKQLVQIQRSDQVEPIAFEPNQVFLLRENIKLQLMSARTALLMRDEAGFHSGLSFARGYIQRYYNIHEPKTSTILDTLQKLTQEKVAIRPLDFSGSLAILRNIHTVEKGKP